MLLRCYCQCLLCVLPLEDGVYLPTDLPKPPNSRKKQSKQTNSVARADGQPCVSICWSSTCNPPSFPSHAHTYSPPPAPPPTNSPKSSRHFFCTIYKALISVCLSTFTSIFNEHMTSYMTACYLCWPDCLSVTFAVSAFLFSVNICLFFWGGGI